MDVLWRDMLHYFINNFSCVWIIHISPFAQTNFVLCEAREVLEGQLKPNKKPGRHLSRAQDNPTIVHPGHREPIQLICTHFSFVAGSSRIPGRHRSSGHLFRLRAKMKRKQIILRLLNFCPFPRLICGGIFWPTVGTVHSPINHVELLLNGGDKCRIKDMFDSLISSFNISAESLYFHVDGPLINIKEDARLPRRRYAIKL